MALKLRYTDVRTRGAPADLWVGLRHAATDENGRVIKTDWIEMPSDDARAIVNALQAALRDAEPQPRR